MLSILGNMDLSAMVPSVYRASASMVLQTTALALAVFIVFKLIEFIYTIVRLERVYGKLPGPKTKHFFRGSFKEMPKDAEGRIMKFVEWANLYSKETGYYRIWANWTRPIIVICHPSSMKRILKTAEPKHVSGINGYLFLKPWLGDGLLISGGQKWARNRRLLTPAFHFEILKPYMNIYNKSADVLVKKLNRHVESGKSFEMFQNICLCTLDIILKCAFSYDVDIQEEGETHPYVQAVTDLSVTVTERFRHPHLLPDLTFYMSSLGRKFKKDCDFVHSVSENIIEKRRLALSQGGVESKKNLDFLDILLTAKDDNGEGLSTLDIRSEVDTFLFEGHDTTASAISWILYSLAKHPEYQEKCQEEIDGVLEGRDSDDLLWSDLQDLEYLTMCIKEGMRLHAPVAIVGRQTTKEMDMGGWTMPKNTNISVNIWALHHNEDVWGKDHFEYVPDRFTRDNVAKMDPYQFVPFSGGPRNCIGQNFAMNEEKTVLSKLLYNFTFRLDPDHVVKKRLAAVMRAENGIMMFAERRKH